MDAMATLARSKVFEESARYVVVTKLYELSAESHIQ